MLNIPCPCGSDQPYQQCCARYIEEKQLPPTPELLMRSRYSAYALGKLDYIAETMRGPAAKDFNQAESTKRLPLVQWQGLTVLNTQLKTPLLGFVSFEARYSAGGVEQIIREKSEFHKIGDRWFYVNGKKLNPNSKSWERKKSEDENAASFKK